MSNLTSIIVLNFNGFEDTIECVDSLIEHIKIGFELIVVDNCSVNDSWNQLRKQKEQNSNWTKVHLVQTTENRGFSAGNNFGVKYAKKQFNSAYFWLLNNDTVIKSDALSPLIKTFRTNLKSGILGSKLMFYDKPDVVQAIGGRFNKYTGKFNQIGFGKLEGELNLEEKHSIDYVVGASLFVSKQFIETVGLLSEDYFLYFEEVDWSIRSHKNGFETLSCLESEVFHKQGSTTKNRANGKRNLKMMYFQFKNLILFYRKYFPGLFFVPFCVITFRCLKLTIKE
ncbi:MAG: glycosyltransferase family 2 protein, partial [Flavobacteriales bacterium]|nr:glycosyltransferase family 2 protein [Flavobacteriales bacterium]